MVAEGQESDNYKKRQGKAKETSRNYSDRPYYQSHTPYKHMAGLNNNRMKQKQY